MTKGRYHAQLCRSTQPSGWVGIETLISRILIVPIKTGSTQPSGWVGIETPVR